MGSPMLERAAARGHDARIDLGDTVRLDGLTAADHAELVALQSGGSRDAGGVEPMVSVRAAPTMTSTS